MGPRTTVTDLYMLLFDHVYSQKPVAHGRHGFYFGENGEYTMHDIMTAISQELYDQGKSKSPTPTSFTEEETAKYFPRGTMLGTNSRCKAERSRRLGWEPNKGYQDLLASIKGEISKADVSINE